MPSVLRLRLVAGTVHQEVEPRRDRRVIARLVGGHRGWFISATPEDVVADAPLGTAQGPVTGPGVPAASQCRYIQDHVGLLSN